MLASTPNNASAADRHVDQEHPVPAVVIGEPAAERRAEDRPDHHAHAPHRHRRAVLLAREHIEQRGLRNRHQRGAEQPLQHAEQHHLADVRSQAAQHRSGGEAGDGDAQQRGAEARGEPAGGRRGDGRGARCTKSAPRTPGPASPTANPACRQRDVGDRRVDHLHHGCQHDRTDQQRQIGDLAMGGDSAHRSRRYSAATTSLCAASLLPKILA
jgi:hypothetical protein